MSAVFIYTATLSIPFNRLDGFPDSAMHVFTTLCAAQKGSRICLSFSKTNWMRKKTPKLMFLTTTTKKMGKRNLSACSGFARTKHPYKNLNSIFIKHPALNMCHPLSGRRTFYWHCLFPFLPPLPLAVTVFDSTIIIINTIIYIRVSSAWVPNKSKGWRYNSWVQRNHLNRE